MTSAQFEHREADTAEQHPKKYEDKNDTENHSGYLFEWLRDWDHPKHPPDEAEDQHQDQDRDEQRDEVHGCLQWLGMDSYDMVLRLRDYADDAQEHRNLWVPVSVEMCHAIADELESIRLDAIRYRWLRKEYGDDPDHVDAIVDREMK